MAAAFRSSSWADRAEPAPRPGDAARRGGDETTMAVLARIADETGVQPMRLMREIAALSFGPGKISFADYVRLRLFDDAFWAGADKRTVIGRRRGREIIAQANRADWHGLCANQAAAAAYLSAFGFATPTRAAVYAPNLAAPGGLLLRARDQLRDFLAEPQVYPLLGRPIEAAPGLGTVELVGLDGGHLIHADGGRQPLESFVEHLCENFAAGYVFDHRPAIHPDAAPIAARRLAGARLVTVATDNGPRLFKAAWILPGRSGADGEVTLSLDPRTGAVLGATCGEGLELRHPRNHPETGAPLVGAVVPGWQALRATAVEAARLFAPLGLVGWRILPTAAGPVVLDIDPSPDLVRGQLADRRGVLTPEFQSFLAERRDTAAARAAGDPEN